MPHYRDAKAGEFLIAQGSENSTHGDGVPSFLRFCRRRGVAGELGARTGSAPRALLAAAELEWCVDHRPVLTELGPGLSRVAGYKALVRPDHQQVMAVVSSSYRVVENEDLALTVLSLAQRHDPEAELVGAASFGRNGERSLFVCRVSELSRSESLVLLAHNRHGGEGAVRVHLAITDLAADAVWTPPVRWASYEIAHVGRIADRLETLRHSPMIDEFLAEIAGPRELMQKARWSPSRTQRLLHELWGDPPDRAPRTVDGRPHGVDDRARRHPAGHLSPDLDLSETAFDAFLRICSFIDNESEACERGDFTKDRDERLALGAGTKLKQKAWRWLIGAVH
jgi:hypothetical protein